MPNFDGTGPQGKGPLTGQGLGTCQGAQNAPRGGFLRRCFRQCRSRRFGQGRGRGQGPINPQNNPQ